MLYGNHLIGDQNRIQLQGFRAWNNTTAGVGTLAAENSGLLLCDTALNYSLRWWDGTAWKTVRDTSLTTDYLWTGVAGQSAEIARSAIPLNDWGALTANKDIGGFTFINAYDVQPTDVDTMLVNKAYVDRLAQGAGSFYSVRAGTTADLGGIYTTNTLTASANGALPPQDGVTLVVDDLLLVKNQTTPVNNGVYRVDAVGDAGNPWVLIRKPTDATSPGASMLEGDSVVNATCFVSEGTQVAQWRQTENPCTVGTHDQTWQRSSGTADYYSGNAIDIDTSRNIHFYSRAGWAVGDLFTGATATSLTRIPIGTDGQLLVARSGAAGWETVTIPPAIRILTANVVFTGQTTQTYTHNWSTQDIVAQVVNDATNQIVYTDVNFPNANEVQLSFAAAQNATYRLTLISEP